MVNPEQGLEFIDRNTGRWTSVDLAPPDVFAPAREAVDDVAQLLIQFLNVLLTVLDVIKAFSLGYLDPLTSMIQALADLIEQWIEDIRNAGFYLHGDWYLLKEGPEFRNLLGGFQAYERRMISRLLDPRDLNRPNISAASTVVAFFFYASSDAENLMRVINFIKGLIALFGRSKEYPGRGLGAATDLKATYGFEGVDRFQGVGQLFGAIRERRGYGRKDRVGQIAPPDVVTLHWKLATAPGNYVSPVARLAPTSFIIEVSTEPNPLRLQYDKVPSGTVVIPGATNRVRGLCVDEEGRTFELTGGYDQVSLGESTFFPLDENSNESRVFAFKNSSDQSPIPIGNLKVGDDYLIQKSFFADGVVVGGYTPGGGYSYTIKKSDLPKAARFNTDGNPEDIHDVDTFYVSVRPVSRRVYDLTDFYFVLRPQDLASDETPVVVRVAPTNWKGEEISLLDRGDPTQPLKITFPNADTGLYLECVVTALLVMVLSRPDLALAVDVEGDPIPVNSEDLDDLWETVVDGHVSKLTGLEDIARHLLPEITGRKTDNTKFWTCENHPIRWRRKVFNRCVALAEKMYRENDPIPAVQKMVVGACSSLLEFKLGSYVDSSDSAVDRDEGIKGTEYSIDPVGVKEMSIFGAMRDDSEVAGIALNPGSVGTKEEDRNFTILKLDEDIDTGNIQNPYGPHFYSVDNSEQREEAQKRVNQAEALSEAMKEVAGMVSNLPSELRVFIPDELGSVQSSLPSAYSVVPLPIVRGSVTDAPIIYTRRGRRITKLTYCRNAFTDEMYQAAAFALGVAMGPLERPENGWITLRLGQLFPGLAVPFDEILAWIRAIAAAVESAAEALRKFIEYIQGRILELQALIRRIEAIILSFLHLFEFLPEGSMLPLSSRGTAGVLQDLVTAQNKPIDGPNYYGGGVVLLASAGPAFPSFVLDILSPRE